MKFSQLRTVRSPLRGIFCLSVFSVLFAQLTGLIFANEQQIVIHWTSETASGSSDLLKDRDGNLLDSGSTSNGDGSIITLGYFDTATTSDPFNGNWVPLTEGTRIGDSSSGYGYADGTFSFTTIFTKNSSTVEVYPNEPNLEVEDFKYLGKEYCNPEILIEITLILKFKCMHDYFYFECLLEENYICSRACSRRMGRITR